MRQYISQSLSQSTILLVHEHTAKYEQKVLLQVNMINKAMDATTGGSGPLKFGRTPNFLRSFLVGVTDCAKLGILF